MRYGELVELYEKLEATTKRLEKTYHIAELLKKASVEDLEIVMLLIKGNIFPKWDQRKIGVASRLVLKVLNLATGVLQSEIEDIWKKTGDLGTVAEQITSKKSQATLFQRDLTIQKVSSNLKLLASTEGQGAVDRKIQLIAELLTSATPLEAKYIIRTVLEDLRVGVGEGSIRDAIVWAFLYTNVNYNDEEKSISLSEEERQKYNEIADTAQEAYDITNDISKVAVVAKTKGIEGLKNLPLEVGKPIKVMLGPKENDATAALERVGRPCQAEHKYDGFRLQIHKDGNMIKLFTRNLENVTSQFPDVVEYVKTNINGNKFILDSEAVGFSPKTGKYMPFQNISQRIKRKYDIEKLKKELPVELIVFDCISYEGKDMLKEPFEKRRKLIEKIVRQEPKKIILSTAVIVNNEDELNKFYKDALSKGYEGIMLKKLDAPYKPGKRVGYMVKMKETEEPLDLVIIGAEWGEGKRTNWFSSFTIACIDADGNYREVGKFGTGVKEKEEEGVTFQQLTGMLKPFIISEKGKEIKVKPKIVVEIGYEEIQKSPTYSSGYALRFPRFIRLREDRSPDEISTLEQVEELFYGQK